MGIPAHGVLTLRKSIRFLGGFVLLALGGALIWSGHRAFTSEKIIENNAQQKLTGTNVLQTVSDRTAKDTDGDGLQDWEEALWGTDQSKPDSDGDGTPDGEEISTGRDPLKSGPNDRIEPPVIPSGDNAPTGNLTYDLTRNILSSGVLGVIDQQGRISSREFLDNLVLPQDLVPETLLQPPKVFTVQDLTAGPDGAEAARRYFEAVTAVHIRHLDPYERRGDLVILVEYLQSGNAAKLAELDPIIAALERTIADIQRLPVPSAYRSFAVQELNYLAKTKRAVEIIRNVAQDPLAAALAVRQRIELLNEVARFHQALEAELAAKGITQNSGG